jgi:acyl-CoA thioesterase FadM
MTTARLGGRSITMRYRTYRPGVERVAAEGLITQVCVDMSTFRTIAVPEHIRAALARHVGD